MERRPTWMDLHRLYLDLRDVEETADANFSLQVTDQDGKFPGHPFPPGITVSANRRYHGADVHLTWPQVRELRDTLTALLKENEQE